ncbi:MAG: DUF1207 domain-containing protein [Planctomycetaceae bacterium]
MIRIGADDQRSSTLFCLVTMVLRGCQSVFWLTILSVVILPLRADDWSRTVSPAVYSQWTTELSSVGHSVFAEPSPLVTVSHQIVSPIETAAPLYVPQPVFAASNPSGVLPDGLLYRSYTAAPHEPRMASVATYDISKGAWRWDSSLGGRVGLFRQTQPALLPIDAWQFDLEGGVMPRLNPEESMDVESMDFRFGWLMTAKRDNLSMKFGYFHISSHAGDEYLLKTPTFERINFVRESLILGMSWQLHPEIRIYGEGAWAFAVRGGAKPVQLQMGAEYAAIADNPAHGAPFSAVNVQLRQEVRFAAGVNVMSGWQWKGPESGRTLRVGMQYYNGPSNQYEFFRRYDNQIGAGIWFDY